MNRYIKPSISLGAISGFVFGVLLLIPFIAPFMFFLIFLLAGIIIIIILKKTNTAGVITVQEGALIGSMAGFSSLIAASVLYIPVAYIIDKTFNAYSAAFSLSITGYELLSVSMLVIFTAILSAIMNAFTGMVTAYIFERLENRRMTFEEHLDMERVDQHVE